MNLQSYITAINETNDVDTLKALWWTIGMDTNLSVTLYGGDLEKLATKIFERYNKIK